jgi:GPH family glycoside/pentoside/hexuronide:cation symporter
MKLFSLRTLFGYGLFGLPLAMVALPIYVYVPQFYAQHFGLSLTLIGAALLAARVLDAFIDPLIGSWIDGNKDGRNYSRFILIALPLLALGFIALFHPPSFSGAPGLLWFLCALMVVYLGFSIATIAHQSWGAALTQALPERSRLTATREGCGLIGVIAAAILTSWLGYDWLIVIFVCVLSIAALVLLMLAPRPDRRAQVHGGLKAMLEPFRNARFRWLFAVFVINGIAAAIPATLFMFFVTDQLQLPQYAGLFLVFYFAAAACSMPLWVALAKSQGEARIWLLAMLLSALSFVWAFALPAGSSSAFGLICVLSGLTLGADLALPPALLAAVIGNAGHSGQREGAYFGAWSWATKMNLALAAGISLPLLELLGYLPGASSSNGLHALSAAYALLPCALKLIAAAVLTRAPLQNI